MRWLRILFPLLLAALSCSPVDRHTQQQLAELDGYVGAREVYVAQKRAQVEAIGRLVQAAPDPLRRYDLQMELADAYFAFSFDSTQHYLKNCLALAESRQDPERMNRAAIQLGHLYAKSGHYMEAYERLYRQIDTATLSPALHTEYLMALFDFSRDLSGNSGMVEQLAVPDRSLYRERLYGLLPRDSERWRLLCLDECIAQERLSSADSLARLLVAGTRPDQHAYAIYAFELSEIAQRRGRPQEQMEWLVKSAESDIINAVKDYASLTLVAQLILNTDVDRSFRYLRLAQEDALFYNAKLRPWQISGSLMQVQDAYQKRQTVSRNTILAGLVLLGVLTLILSLATHLLVVRSRKLTRTRLELENANTRLSSANLTLSELNRQISQADKVKQRYILSFLEGLSSQISLLRAEDNRFRNLLKQGKADQLLKELSITGRSEKARDEFYETFDATFLAMFPDFVDQFNALLREPVLPPRGRLNTELRIFALICLGVDDSKRIAAMLDYSLSTIYNLKVRVKNLAAGDRDHFEEQVKQLVR